MIQIKLHTQFLSCSSISVVNLNKICVSDGQTLADLTWNDSNISVGHKKDIKKKKKNCILAKLQIRNDINCDCTIFRIFIQPKKKTKTEQLLDKM